MPPQVHFDRHNRHVQTVAMRERPRDERIEALRPFKDNLDLSGSISKEQVKTRMDKLESSKKKLQKQHKEMQRKSNILNKEATTIQQLEETRLWWASYADQLEDKDKRALIDALVEEIRVYPFQYPKDHPNPEDSRTPIVQIEITGSIPMRDALFGSCKVSE